MKYLLSTLFYFVLMMTVMSVGMASENEIGQIKTLKGEVFLIQGNTKSEAKPGDLLHQADVVETGNNGKHVADRNKKKQGAQKRHKSFRLTP